MPVKRPPRLDVIVDGVRIVRAYGTDDTATQDNIKNMVHHLHRSGTETNSQVLKDIKENRLTLLDAYKAYQKGNLNENTAFQNNEFVSSALEWVKTYDKINDRTRIDYTESLKQLRKVKKTFPVSDLPYVIREYRKRCLKRGTHTRFKTVRAICMSYLRDTFGKSNSIYNEIKNDIEVLGKKTKPEGQQYQGRARPVSEVWKAVQKMKPAVGAQFWQMCTTGIGMTEYENGLTVEGEGIRVRGEKMVHKDDRRNRLTLKVSDTIAPLVVHSKRFRGHLEKALSGLRPYDARRCFSMWCISAGIDFMRVRQYMGHLPRSTTEHYSRAQLDSMLKEDSEKLRQYIEKNKKLDVSKVADKFFTFD